MGKAEGHGKFMQKLNQTEFEKIVKEAITTG